LMKSSWSAKTATGKRNMKTSFISSKNNKKTKLFFLYDIVVTKLSKVLLLVTKLSYNMTLPVCNKWP
jgi:hypothetical protein